MSVSGVSNVPGFDVLFPSTSSSSAGTSSAAPASGTSNGTSSSSTTSSVPGSDVLNASFNAPNVPGFDVLNPAQYFPNATNIVNGSNSSTPSSSSSSNANSTTVNPYQQAYDNVETWSASYLMSSVENGAPSTLPDYAGGTTASAFAQLNQTLAALKPLVALDAGAATGTSSASTSNAGTNVDTVA